MQGEGPSDGPTVPASPTIGREGGHLVVMVSGSGSFCLYLKPSLACLWL